MTLQADGPAPYAPPTAVIAVMDGYRRSGLSPIGPDVLTRLGIGESLIPRTIRSLRVLDLIDEAGNPTDTFRELRKAPTDEYQEGVADFIRGEYQDVFALIGDPAEAPLTRIQDAFRGYTPHGQLERMVTLFLGLCEYAGLVESGKARAAEGRQRARTRREGNGTPRVAKKRDRDAAAFAPPPPPPPPPAPPSHELPEIVGALVAKLPAKGEQWTAADAEWWLAMARMAFPREYGYEPRDREGPHE